MNEISHHLSRALREKCSHNLPVAALAAAILPVRSPAIPPVYFYAPSPSPAVAAFVGLARVPGAAVA